VLATNAQIIRAIRTTIERLEQDSEVAPDDPALETLKRLLLRRLAMKNDSETKESAALVLVDKDAAVDPSAPDAEMQTEAMPRPRRV
jgi:hypothetical protein